VRSKTSEDLLFWRLCCASQNLLFSIAFLHKCKWVNANELHVCVAEVKPATSYQPLEPVTHTNCRAASSCVGSTSMMLEVAIHHIKQLFVERSWNASHLHILCIGHLDTTVRFADLDLWRFDLDQLSYMAGHVTNFAIKYEDPTPIRSWVTSYKVSHWLPLKMHTQPLRISYTS